MDIVNILNQLDNSMYYPFLIIFLMLAGLYFTALTKGIQIRLFGESIRILLEPPEDDDSISSLQAMLVSTASRVGTANIVGVSTAICLGGPGAVFWMWFIAIITAASAFIESTLAQVYKRKDSEGRFFGGPAYYIEHALHKHKLSVLFSIFLIVTYAVGFNMLCSYNLQSTFIDYSFYNPASTPFIVGALLAILTGYCIIGGGERIVKFTGIIVPFMGIAYVVICLIVVLFNIQSIPSMLVMIFQDAFDLSSIFGGVAGSSLVYGIKRSVFSNEAGIGSAPNAAASADVSHPVKQGLAQVLSVYIDTLFLSTATAFMCLSTGVARNVAVAGAPYVQNAIQTVFGTAGHVFIIIAMVLFAFTTLIGNLYYVDSAFFFLNNKNLPSKKFMLAIHLICAFIVFVGAIIPMDAAWAMADITMGGMIVINLPVCLLLAKIAIDCMKDYENQKKDGKNPVFKAKSIGLNEDEMDCWK